MTVKLSVLMPVYNESPTLEQIIAKVQQVPIDKELVLVDDFSTDGSREILKDLERKNDPRLKVLYHEKNRGKGAAIRTGIQATSGEYIIIQDADLEYDPNDYLKLMTTLEQGHADVVYGSRFLGKFQNMSLTHLLGNKVLTVLTNLLYGTKLTDMETCYKLVKGPIFKSITIKTDRFNFEPEITAKLLKKKLRIVEVPISYDGRAFDQGKKISWKDGFAAIWALIKFRFLD
jgi:glycosyltransferase involved in cell wall biosynthesis